MRRSYVPSLPPQLEFPGQTLKWPTYGEVDKPLSWRFDNAPKNSFSKKNDSSAEEILTKLFLESLSAPGRIS